MRHYHQAAIESANGIQLIVALYDGMQRFLAQAAAACEQGDVAGRREASRRALNIILHLQANLRMDVGADPAQRLSDFYTALFADILRASASASAELFRSAAREVRNVREAWKLAAQDPAVVAMLPRDLQTADERGSAVLPIRREPQEPASSPAWIA